MKKKLYKYDDWFIQEPVGHEFDSRIYIDKNNEPITGILEDFYCYEKNDPRNNVYVENGKIKPTKRKK